MHRPSRKDAPMAIGPLQSLAGLSIDECYLVYTAIAQADHQHRRTAMYGDETPPPGHAPFRVVPLDCFADRLQNASEVVGGTESFLASLSRQACAYGVDVPAVLARHRSAA